MEAYSNDEPLFGRVNKLLGEEITRRGSNNISQKELTNICQKISKDTLKSIKNNTAFLKSIYKKSRV